MIYQNTPGVFPPTIGGTNVVTRDGKRVVVSWQDMTYPERIQVIEDNVKRNASRMPDR